MQAPLAYLIEQIGPMPAWLLSAGVVFLRYSLFAGPAFWICYVWRRNYLARRKIQVKQPHSQAIWRELRYSAMTALVFALVALGVSGLRQLGLTRIYDDPLAYGAWYLPASFVLMVVLHDAYFYWMHRLVHHPRLFRWVHLAHHRSHNPTPWASLAFDPLEALLEIAIVPVMMLVIPIHPAVFLAFVTWALLWNIVGHLGYELFPRGWVDHPVLRWINTSTHHNMHHRYARGNYSLYFNWWDTWMRTNHPAYRETFRQVTQESA